MTTIPKTTFPSLENPHWHLGIHPHTGAIARITHPEDSHGMNWISDSAENSTFLDSHGWGLGFLAMPGCNGPQRWQRPEEVAMEENGSRARYLVGAIEVTVSRRLHGDRFDETFEFRNIGEVEQSIWGLGLYAPFNDNYPDAATCVTRRCNAHLWCGGNTAYACCLRMGGMGPHLGLVMTEGFIGGYSIEGRGAAFGRSNLRGSIVFIANGLTLQPGQTHRIAWTCFWHQGWEDFFARSRAIPGFVEVKADRYTYVSGKPPTITVSDASAKIEPLSNAAGEQTVKIHYGEGRETWLRLNAIEDVAELVRRRVAFILEHQQVNDSRSPYDGAFVCYDNETQVQLPHGYRADCSEGRERLGMGVLLAQSLAHWRDAKVEAALKRYHAFVRAKLQLPDGTVLGEVGGDSHRLYNFPWVAQFHLEMFHAFGAERYLEDCFQTFEAYYRQGGDRFYPIGLPIVDAVEAFRAAGREAQARQLLAHFLRHGDQVAKNGLNIPPHEVNYEQTIVCPAVSISLECYQLTGEERYLACAKELLPALEAFGGRQPDHRLNDIAIRHWDGYWFGKREAWGDTFPHYWSATTGWAFYRYWQATGDENYLHRGREILMNNLSSFRPDGSATCAYLYPDVVNGEHGRFADPLANDQDWALVLLMQAAQIDSSLFGGSIIHPVS
jgi:hypothetical protein